MRAIVMKAVYSSKGLLAVAILVATAFGSDEIERSSRAEESVRTYHIISLFVNLSIAVGEINCNFYYQFL